MSVVNDPARRPAFFLLFAVSMVMATGNTALQSVLPAIGREIGVADTLIAAVYSLSALAWTLSAPVWARVSDSQGRKPLVMLGLFGFCLSMAGFGLFVFLGLKHWAAPAAVFAGLLVSRAIYGLIGSAATPAAQAYVADRTAREERTEAMALLASAFGLGTVVGPALAPFFVLPVLGLAGPMVVFVLIGLLTLVLVARGLPSGDAPTTLTGLLDGVRPTRAARAESGPSVFKDPEVRPFLIWGFLMGSAQALNGQILGFHVIDELGVSPIAAQSFIGIAMLAGAGATLIAQWGLIRLLRLTPKGLLRWGAGLAVAGNLLLAFAPDFYAVVIGFTLASLGYGFARPGFTAGASLAVGTERQGAVAGAITSINGAAWLVAPVAGVALYEAVAPAPFVLNAVLLAGLVAYAVRSPALRRAGEHAVADEVDTPR